MHAARLYCYCNDEANWSISLIFIINDYGLNSIICSNVEFHANQALQHKIIVVFVHLYVVLNSFEQQQLALVNGNLHILIARSFLTDSPKPIAGTLEQNQLTDLVYSAFFLNLSIVEPSDLPFFESHNSTFSIYTEAIQVSLI